MVDGQNELNLEQGEPADTADAAAKAQIADTGQGDAGDLTVPAADPPTPEPPADTAASDAGDRGASETAPEPKAPDAGVPAKSQTDAVAATAGSLDFSTVPPDVLRVTFAPIARMMGDRVDATLGPACSELNDVATATLRSMKSAASEAADLARSVGEINATTGQVLDSVENAAAETAGPDGGLDKFMDTRKEFALFRKDIARHRSYESRVRRWALRVLLAVCVTAVPLAFVAGGFAQRDHAVLDFGREAGFRRAWSDWIWRNHSTGLLDCALEARRRGEALTCQIRMAPPQ